jgi:hypothetical protein
MSLGKHFTPFWLHTIKSEHRNEVVEWLKRWNIDVDRCSSFHFDGKKVTCHMYRVNEQGTPQITTQGDPIMDVDESFTPASIPNAVSSYL